MPIKNIIFDVDGTLWDSTEIVAKAWSVAASKVLGKKVELTAERVKREFGKTMVEIMRNLFPNESTDMQSILKENCIEYEHVYIEKDGAKFYPNVIDGIKNFYSSYNLFIVSNAQSGYIELVIDKGQLELYIKDHLSYGDTGEGKAYNIKKIIEKHNLLTNETVYVGDIQGDHDASHEAGIKMIYCSYGFGKVDTPDYVIDDFSEIGAVIEKI